MSLQVSNRMERFVQYTGHMKINIDGSSFENSGHAGFGGLIRDEHGRWISDFSIYIDITTNMQAELGTILQGLMTAIDWERW